MKTLTVLLLSGVSLLAQLSARPYSAQREASTATVAEAAPQPAQDVTIHLTAEIATALESLRLNILAPAVTTTAPDGTRIVTQSLLYPDIKSLVDAALRAQGNLFPQALLSYPPAELKGKLDAAKAAQDAANEAAASAAAAPVKPPPVK